MNNKQQPYLAILVAACMLLFASVAHASWWDKIGEIFGGKESVPTTSSAPKSTSISNADINQAFKQALEIGSETVVKQLSQKDGFNLDNNIRIPLPPQLNTAREWLGKIGASGVLDDLEVSLNRAAEKATPQAKALFVNAIKEMTFDDVRTIYKGSNDAATRYFQQKMTPKLTEVFTPVVSDSLSDVGAVKYYDKMINAYEQIPFVPEVNADLTTYVVDESLDGIFYYLAKEEAAIRQNPVKRATELLKKVFGR